MSVDRSVIRVKALLVAPHPDGERHLVSLNPPTVENPEGYHRLIGGSVELGETHRDAIVREVQEELAAQIQDLELLDVVENIFRIDGVLGHEIAFLYTGRLDPLPPEHGGVLTESDGSTAPLVWRPYAIDEGALPCYPLAAMPYAEALARKA